MLIVDSVYGPVRHFADTVLKRIGVDDDRISIPAIGADIDGLFDDRTSVVYLEAPGSLTFEMQDVPAIAAVAHDRGALRRRRQHLGDAALLQAARPRRRHRR